MLTDFEFLAKNTFKEKVINVVDTYNMDALNDIHILFCRQLIFNFRQFFPEGWLQWPIRREVKC